MEHISTKYIICIKNDLGNFIKINSESYNTPEEASNKKIEFLSNLNSNLSFKSEKNYILEHICIVEEKEITKTIRKLFD